LGLGTVHRIIELEISGSDTGLKVGKGRYGDIVVESAARER